MKPGKSECFSLTWLEWFLHELLVMSWWIACVVVRALPAKGDAFDGGVLALGILNCFLLFNYNSGT
jgi:hypothetical protein